MGYATRLNLMRVATLVWWTCSAIAARAENSSREQVNYTEHIRPIFSARCVACHRPGQIGPMGLRNYDEVRPWAKSIKAAVVAREMPPFSAAGPLGRYVDDPRLSDAEIELITRWVDTGAPRGPHVHEEATVPAASDSEGFAGTPDLVLESTSYAVQDVNDDYVTHFIDYVFPEETWIGRIELLQTDYSIVHHSLLHVLKADESTYEKELLRRVATGRPYVTGALMSLKYLGLFLGGWLPGRTSEVAMHYGPVAVPAGSRLVLNNHYYSREKRLPGESRPTVQTKIGLYFHTGEIAQVRDVSGPLTVEDLEIPPGEPNYERIIESVIPVDAFIETYDIHMHLRGKSSEATLVYPDGRRELIFEVPRYDFDWQQMYRLKEPIFAPKGSRIIHRGVWDNSAGNPENPDPTQTVTTGLFSGNEMWVSAVVYFEAAPRAEPIRIVNGRRIE